jgi:adenylate cyclase
MNKFLVALRRNGALVVDRLGTRWRNNFYIFAAVIFTLAAVADVLTVNFVGGMKNTSFDAMVKFRFHVRPPAHDIVIVDIDEKSLAAMAGEFGRWPWPRQVFGEFVQNLERQKATAVVFDILFSDPDIYNSESDAYFNEAMAGTDNTWFPMVRLPASADTGSRLRTSQLPHAAATDTADTASTIAVVLPFFSSVQQSKRMGFNNIYPDDDGVCREYPVAPIEHGYEILSLPFLVARAQNPSIKPPKSILLNWRGKPFTYKHISFSDVYADMRLEHPKRPPDEFARATVIIGSTAPSLYDIKVTAVDRQFPGVEILATAIDNMRSGDWLSMPRIPLVYFLVTLCILWMTAIGFFRRGTGGQLDQFYGLSQFILIAIAYTAINLFNVYINLTGPVMFGFAYYSVSRYYAFATARALDNSVVRINADRGGAFGCLLALRFDLPTREENLIARLGGVLTEQCKERPSAEWLSGRQKGFWRLFENTLFLCWQADAVSETRLKAIRAEADAVCASIRETLNGKSMDGVLPYDRLTISRAEGGIGDREQEDWRTLMGAALLGNKGGKDS